MTWVMVDVETDGPIPGKYSMIEIGAVVVDSNLDKTFSGKLKPISSTFDAGALSVTGYTRELTLKFPEAYQTILLFCDWLKHNVPGRPMFISDNNGFDWMFVWGREPSNSGRRDWFYNFRELRK